MLLENCEESVGGFPVFRTGLGESVTVKQSSIAKALSVLSDDSGAHYVVVFLFRLSINHRLLIYFPQKIELFRFKSYQHL